VKIFFPSPANFIADHIDRTHVRVIPIILFKDICCEKRISKDEPAEAGDMRDTEDDTTLPSVLFGKTQNFNILRSIPDR
jgi:hypothetical protein